MALINWQDSYSVGIPLIDHDHKLLVSITNRLHDAICAEQGRDVIARVLHILSEYTKTHFVREEKLMEKGNYPDLEAHKEEHIRLAEQVQEIVSHYRAGDAHVDQEALDFLKNWLTNHILGSDMHYLPYVQGVELTRDEVLQSMEFGEGEGTVLP